MSDFLFDKFEGMRTCTICGEMKPLEKFGLNGLPGKRRKYCRRCYKRKKRGKQNAGVGSRKHRAVDLFGRKCADCGFVTDIDAVYEFHHTGPRLNKNTPAKILRDTWRAFVTESERLVMLCANCHRVRHHHARNKS